MNFTAIDFETANSNRGSICSIGLAVVESGKIVKSDHLYVKPSPNYYDTRNTSIHGIQFADTANEKTLKQRWRNLKKYFDNRSIIAHNASFDCSVLRFALDVNELDYPNLEYYCTYMLSKETLKLPSYKLDSVCRHFKIKLDHHNAMSDANASALIAIKLCEKYKVDSLEEFSTSLGYRAGKIFRNTRTYEAFSKS